MTQVVNQDRFSGVILLGRGSKILFLRAYGLADKQKNIPNTIHTKFALASLAKTFTIIAIAKLYKNGKLKLNVPKGRYTVIVLSNYTQGRSNVTAELYGLLKARLDQKQ